MITSSKCVHLKFEDRNLSEIKDLTLILLSVEISDSKHFIGQAHTDILNISAKEFIHDMQKLILFAINYNYESIYRLRQHYASS